MTWAEKKAEQERRQMTEEETRRDGWEVGGAQRIPGSEGSPTLDNGLWGVWIATVKQQGPHCWDWEEKNEGKDHRGCSKHFLSLAPACRKGAGMAVPSGNGEESSEGNQRESEVDEERRK